jgi:hypothetical protein
VYGLFRYAHAVALPRLWCQPPANSFSPLPNQLLCMSNNNPAVTCTYVQAYNGQDRTITAYMQALSTSLKVGAPHCCTNAITACWGCWLCICNRSGGLHQTRGLP